MGGTRDLWRQCLNIVAAAILKPVYTASILELFVLPYFHFIFACMY